MAEFLSIAIGGLFGGCILAILGIGYTIAYRTIGTLNLPQGAFIVLGALASYSFHVQMGLPTWLALLLSLLGVGVIAAVIQATIIQPSMGRLSRPNLLILMAGLLISLEGLATVGWGSTVYAVAPFSHTASIRVGGLDIATQGLWILGLTSVLLVGLWFVLGRSFVGKALRASVDSRFAARLSGIPVGRIALGSYCVSGAAGALAGAFLLPYNSLSSASVLNYSLLGLVAAALGGMGSIFGAVLGGLVLGIVEALVTGYVSTTFGSAISMGFLILVLVLRPQGLLGRHIGRLDSNEVRLGEVPVTPALPIRWSRGALGLVAVLLLVMPMTGTFTSQLATMNIVGVFALVAVGLDLLSGTSGQVSLGQGGFMAVGGYTGAYLMVTDHVTPLLALLAGAAAATFVGVLFGLLVRKTSGLYLAVITLAFGVLAEQLATNFGFLGGSGGLVGIPAFSAGGFSFDTDQRFYYLIWAFVISAGILVGRINRSPWGKLLKSLHGDPMATSIVGFNVTRGKIVCLALSALLAGTSGVLYACDFRYLSPGMVGSAQSITLIAMVVVGGMGTVAGPILGVALFTYLPTWSQSFVSWFGVMEGVLLVMVMRFFPSGLFGGVVMAFDSILRKVRLRRGLTVLPAGPSPETKTELRISEPQPTTGPP